MADVVVTLSLEIEQLKRKLQEVEAGLKKVPASKETKLTGDSKGLLGAISDVQKQLLALAAGTFAITKVWQVANTTATTAVREARDATVAQQLLQSQLETTGNAAGFTAEELMRISTELQNMSNIGDDALITNLTIPLTTFRKISGEVFTRTQQAVLDLNAVLGDPNNPASLRSSAIQVGKALNDPIQGLTALRRVGVSYSDSQISVIKNLVETNRLTEAQDLILQELELEFGGAAKAAQTSSMQIKNSWLNMLEAMGTTTLPMLDGINMSFANFFDIMTRNMNAYADNTGATQQRMFEGWNEFSTAFILNANAVGGFIINTGGAIAGAIEGIFTINKKSITLFAKNILAVVNELPSAVMDVMSIGSFERLKDLANGVGDNYKQVGKDVSGYLSGLKAQTDAALSGIVNYEKNYEKITAQSKESYAEMLTYKRGLLEADAMNEGLGAGATGQSAVEKAKSDYEKLNDAMLGYIKENETARLSAYGKELVQLEDKYRAELEIINAAEANKEISTDEAAEKRLQLEEIYANKSFEVQDKINAEIAADVAEREQQELKAQAEAKLRKLADEETYYNTMKFMDMGYAEWKIAQYGKDVDAMAISEEQKVALKKKFQEEIETEIGKLNLQDTSDKQAKAERDSLIDKLYFNKKRELIDQEVAAMQVAEEEKDRIRAKEYAALDQQKEAYKTTYANILSSAQSIVSGLLTLNRQRKEDAIAKLDETAEREKWTNERLLAEKKKLNKNYEAEERKLKNVQKAMSIVQAIMNTAQGVTAALTLPPPLSFIMASVVGAMGAAQVAIMSAQKFAQGGLFRGKGGTTEDANIIAISDGEYIVNAAATKRFKPVLDVINYGGNDTRAMVPKIAYAAGGQVNASMSYAGADLGAKLDKLDEDLQILNRNLVRKEMTVNVQNSSDISTIVRKTDQVRAEMVRGGYVPAV